jgi:hypothetical protein
MYLLGDLLLMRNLMADADSRFGLPVVVNSYLKPDQWVLLDEDGNIIAVGNGVE